MKNLVVSLSTIFVVVLFVSGPLLAHHGEVNYDTEKVVSVKGTVTNFQFINPHVQIFLDVKNDKGEIEQWIGEARSPSMLVRLGAWDKSTLKVGDIRRRTDRKFCVFRRLCSQTAGRWRICKASTSQIG
jgi:Family of unknown function (DUF6152)